tara:strand:- start:272 stop:457 length:186 start_codon:yes stop_codon:yes gene_type:complete
MKTFRLVLTACAVLLIGLELWDALVRGGDLNWLLVIAMALLLLSFYVASRGADRWRTGAGE